MKRSLPLGTFLLAMLAGTTLHAALEESDKSWIGEFTADPSGWDYHSSLGWLWSIRDNEANVWIYSATYKEWQWTGEGTYPSLWSENLAWLYYLAGESPASNWFYVFNQKSWIGGDEWMVTEDGIAYVRTPESRFQGLPDWPYEYRYVEIDGLRQAYAEAGPSDGPVVLLLHGQPTWSYLYRKMIPVLAEAGYRVIAMDHLGMGRSDKPIDIDAYTYLGHNDRLEKFIQALALQDINLFVQDWGSLIGLRVAGLNPEWFASIAVGNGALPVWPAGTEVHPVVENPDEILDLAAPYALMPDQQPLFYNGCQRLFPFSPDGFADWMEFAMKSSQFVPSGTVEAQTWFPISAAVEAAYDAPFPSRLYMAGTRKFPSLVNEVPGTTDQAWVGLSNFTRPFVTIWASNDIGEMGSCEAAQIFIDGVPGAAGQPHVRLPESSHFLQDDQGEEIARRLVEFYLLNGIASSQSGAAIWDATNGQIVNDGTSDDPGPFAVESITIAETTIHYPSGIEDIASKFFVIGWGNGSGTNGGDQYPVYFDRLVSYGFVVAASHSPRVNGELILESVQVAMSQNDNPESPLYQKLESHFGVMGKSLGGIAAAGAVQDSTDAVASVMIAGSSPGVTDPGLFVTGTKDFLQPVVRTGYNDATGPAIYAVEEGAAHFPDLSESTDVADISTAFMRHFLRGDPNTFAYITDPDAQSGNWAEYELKNFGIDPSGTSLMASSMISDVYRKYGYK